MSDFELPELPSDEELGISGEEPIEDIPADEPELSEEEMAALLGEDSNVPEGPPPPPPPKGDGPPDGPPSPGESSGEPSGPRNLWRGPSLLALIALLVWGTSSYRTLPSPVRANAPDTVFSSARAMAHLVEIARRPHATGSPDNARVRAYLVERLRDLGLEPEIQTETSMVGRNASVRAATVNNIVARIPGTGSTGAIVLTAHYDSREVAGGAGDDGVGVVTILETVRALLTATPQRNDVIVLLTDGEELGLLGARAFVDAHPLMPEVAVVLSVEMRGGGGPSIMFETGVDNGWIVDAMKESGIRPAANSISYEVYKYLPNDTDFTPFREAGRQGLNFAAIGRASVYHQAYDVPSNVSEATLQHHGANLLGVVRYLGGENLAATAEADVTYFSVPVLGLVVYGMGFVLPLAAALAALAAVVLLVVRRGGGRWAGILAGLVFAVVSIILVAATGRGLMAWLPRFHPEFGSLHGGAFHHEGWYVLALVGTTAFVVTSLFGVLRRWFGAAELTWGALLVPLAAMVFAALRFPAAAMNLQWPLGAALLGTALLVVPVGRRTAPVLWVLSLVLAIPVLAVMVPIVQLMWLGLSLAQAAVLGLLMVLMALMLLPAVERLREPNRWWAPLTTFVLGAACLGMGIRNATPTPASPAPSTLVYAYDRGSGEALWVTDDASSPVDEAAGAWAVARTGVAFGERRPLARFGLRTDREYRTHASDAVEVSPPEVRIVSDTTVATTRTLRLALRSAVGAEMMQFRLPEGSGTRLVSVNGESFPIQDDPTLLEYWGSPADGIVLALEMAAGTQPEFDIVEHLLRPAEILGADRFERPATLAPDITWQSDRAILRTPGASLGFVSGPGVPPEGDL